MEEPVGLVIKKGRLRCLDVLNVKMTLIGSSDVGGVYNESGTRHTGRGFDAVHVVIVIIVIRKHLCFSLQ